MYQAILLAARSDSAGLTGTDQGCKAKSTGFPESVEGHPLREATNDVAVQWVTIKLQKGEPVDLAFIDVSEQRSLMLLVLLRDHVD